MQFCWNDILINSWVSYASMVKMHCESHFANLYLDTFNTQITSRLPFGLRSTISFLEAEYDTFDALELENLDKKLVTAELGRSVESISLLSSCGGEQHSSDCRFFL